MSKNSHINKTEHSSKLTIPIVDTSINEEKVVIDLQKTLPQFKQSFLCDNTFSVVKGMWEDIPIYRTFNAGTAEVLVTKVIEFFSKGVSDSYSLTPYFPRARKDFVEKSAATVAEIYSNYAPQILNSSTVVFGGAHRAVAYVACLLGAFYLPTKFQSFTNDWRSLLSLKNWVAGFDLPADPLIYLWQYIAEDLPNAYKKLLKKVKNIVIVKSSNLTPMKKYMNGYLDLSVLRAANSIQNTPPSDLPPYAHNRLPLELSNLPMTLWHSQATIDRPQWEWNVEHESIAAINDYCSQNNINLTIIDEEEVDLFSFVSEIALKWYEKNEISPERLVFNGYHIAHPYYEFSTNSIPILSYKWKFPHRTNWILNFQKKVKLSCGDAFLTPFGGDKIDQFNQWLYKNFQLERISWNNDNYIDIDAPCRYICELLSSRENLFLQDSSTPLSISDLS